MEAALAGAVGRGVDGQALKELHAVGAGYEQQVSMRRVLSEARAIVERIADRPPRLAVSGTAER
ncbi:hypothetical protein [Streptomyces sp. DH12]|uniref:hypothetical protein n=1 Tax=Streptomyces sp. DH12 TaxID=2857010 RepID=UPI001E544352|nr:hypothetical protein [Streptomyces sp. DH12]